MVIDEKDRELKKLMRINKHMKTKFKGFSTVLAEHKRRMARYQTQLKEAKTGITAIENVDLVAEDETVFDQRELARLDAFPLFKKCDREFVSTALEMMYKNNEILRTRVLKKNKKTRAETKNMTPQKREKIRCLMHERVSKIDNPVEQLNRMQEKYINSIISKSLTMARKQLF